MLVKIFSGAWPERIPDLVRPVALLFSTLGTTSGLVRTREVIVEQERKEKTQRKRRRAGIYIRGPPGNDIVIT